MIHGQAEILVEIERRDAREVELLLLMQPHELLIQPQRGRARRHAKDGTRLRVEQFRDDLRRALRLRCVSYLITASQRPPPPPPPPSPEWRGGQGVRTTCGAAPWVAR